MRYLLLICFACTSFSNAQELKENQYLKGVDYVTCECMSVVLKNKTIDCKSDVITIKDIPSDQSISIALFNELQSLKKEKKKNVDFLVNQIFRNEKKFQLINAFAKKNAAQLSNIKLKIENYFVTEDTSETVSDPPQINEEPVETYSETSNEAATDNVIIKPSEKNMQPSYIEQNLLALIFGIILIILIFYIILKNIEFKKELKVINKRIDRRASIGAVNTENNKNIGNLDFENKFQEINRKINNLENSFTVLNQKSVEKPIIANAPIPKPESVNDIFYMSVPNEDGTFDVNGNTNKDSALYEFTVDLKNPSTAKFSFIATDTKIIQSVVDYSQSYINPACDAQNALNQNAKRIITIRPGTAEKRNDKWVVTTKSQIKYE